MAICKFYQQGNCKFGNSCRFEHPRSQPANRFGALAAGASSAGVPDALAKYNLSAEIIERDLTTEKPQWILSAYAPGRDAPDQLFGGFPREQSFEELRLHYMLGKASGHEQEALNQAQDLYQNARKQMENAVRNVQEAVRFMLDCENRHPNRHDICRAGTHGEPFGEFLVGKRRRPMADAFASGSGNAPSAFGTGAQPASSFGQPSALGQRPNPFGAPAFGQPARPASGFGQPSQPPQPAAGFGQTSHPPQPASAFGQPSQSSQPAAGFGQPSQPSSSFAQQPQGGGSSLGQGTQPLSAFGQPSALGAKPNPFGTPAFGQAAQPNTQGSAFGQPSQLGQKPNPFAANANPATNASPFVTISNNAAPAANPFGAPSSTNQNNAAPGGAFGQPSTQSSASPFASAPTSTSFAAANQPQTGNNPFAQKPQPQTNGAFGQPAGNPFAQNAAQGAGAFGQPAAPQPLGAPQAQQKPAAGGNPYSPGSTKQHPPLESYSSRTVDGRLANFKGKPVTYKGSKPGVRAFDGTWSRIWFPDGPPGYCQDTELPPDKYDEKSQAEWAAFSQTGAFADGIMPQLPPPRECTRWDF